MIQLNEGFHRPIQGIALDFLRKILTCLSILAASHIKWFYLSHRIFYRNRFYHRYFHHHELIGRRHHPHLLTTSDQWE